jgi:hypothetical protein
VEAIRVLALSVDGFISLKSTRMQAWSRIYMADALAQSGALADARCQLAAAMDAAPDCDPVRAAAMARLARVEIKEGNGAAALVAVTEALVLIEAGISAADEDSFVRLVHAESLHAVGRLDEAAIAVRAVCEQLLARAAGIGDPDLRQSFLERVPDNVRAFEHARAWRIGVPSA